MQRKLIKQGINGHTIYVPKKWVDERGLKAGDAINIIQENNSLIISARGKAQQKTSVLLNKKEEIHNTLTHLYRNGYDSIHIQTKYHAQVRRTLQVLLGFEVIDQKDDSITIENVSEPDAEKYETIFNRIFFINQQIYEQTKQQIVSKNFESIEALRNDADRSILFCRRLISKKNVSTNSLLDWELLTFLTHIGHTHYYLHQYASTSKPELNTQQEKWLEKIGDLLELYHKAYRTNQIDNLHMINESRKLYLDDLTKNLNNPTTGYMREIIRLIQVGTSPLMARALDH